MLAKIDAKSQWLHLFDFSPLCVCKCLLKVLALIDVKSHCSHLFSFSPPCVFKCVLKLLALIDAKSHWLHVLVLFSTVRLQMCPQIACLDWCKVAQVAFDFSPLCLCKCFLKVLAKIDAKSQWPHLFDSSPLCVSSKCTFRFSLCCYFNLKTYLIFWYLAQLF